MGDLTPPPLRGLSSKERKYDRQLRLWAASGQAALEESHVLLINSGAGIVGTETLKNLVLPGIGQFTVLDPSTVTLADLGSNFFLEDSDLGKSRATCCSRLLQELNPDVQGHSIEQSFDAFINATDALQPFTLILATLPLSTNALEHLSQHSHDTSVPVFYIRSVGFYSLFTLQLPAAFPIVDTHPDPASVIDLRLLQPWSELLEFSKVKTSNLPDMDDEEHSHIPYALLLLSSLEEWKSKNDGRTPTNYKEKSEFRELLKQHIRTNNSDGGEENFDEAIAAVLKTLNPATPSSAVREVFEAEECRNLTKDSAAFWIISHAVSSFFHDHDQLPLSGAIPDMKAKTHDFVSLQNIYKTKARQDVVQVHNRVKALEQSLGRPETIDIKEIEAYCKCAGYIKLIRGRTPHITKFNSHFRWRDRARSAANLLQDPDSLLLIYIAFLGYNYLSENLVTKTGSVDSEEAQSLAISKSALAVVDDLLREAEFSLDDEEKSEIKDRLDQIAKEIARAQSGELHNISALTGGMVAQEVIKVITKQYIPIDNTCIFDGVLSKSSVLRL